MAAFDPLRSLATSDKLRLIRTRPCPDDMSVKNMTKDLQE